MQLARAQAGRDVVRGDAAVYAVVRPDWEGIGYAVGVRVLLVLALSAVGAVLICGGFRPW